MKRFRWAQLLVFAFLAVAYVGVGAGALLAQADSTAAGQALQPVLNLTTAAAGVAAAAVLGGLKHVTSAADTAIGKAIKPVQPAIVLGLAWALPALTNALHLTAIPDAQVVAAAPTAALVGILARELASRIFKLGSGPSV